MSDYQSRLKLRENPLYREVYRHLEVADQTLMMVGDYPDRMVFLMINTPGRATTDRERDGVHLLGLAAGRIGHRLVERERLDRICSRLAARFSLGPQVSVGAKTTPRLSPAEGRLLAGLVRDRPREEIAARLGWRRDTLDRRLAALRERLGFDNTAQLVRALVAARP
jgi:hypothetical protein